MSGWPGIDNEDHSPLSPLLNADDSYFRRGSVVAGEASRSRSRRRSVASRVGSLGSDDPAVRMMGRRATDPDELSDCGEDLEVEATARELGPFAMAKAAGVVAATGVALASFGASLAASAALALPAGPVTAVAVAGYVCFMMTPLVWWSEWRLAHLPGELGRSRGGAGPHRPLAVVSAHPSFFPLAPKR